MYKRILLAVDLNDDWSWHKALPTTLQMCKAFSAELEVISVIPTYGNSWVGEFFPKGYELKMITQLEAHLKKFIERNIPQNVAVNYKSSMGKVYEEVIEHADNINADLIVMASHNPSSKDYVMGPNASQVVRRTTRSVLVVRG
ncbi:MAG: universal stress protein [Marinomonas sp.]